MGNLFWPSEVKPYPNIVQRFGRLLHWLATAIAAMWVALALFGMNQDAASSGKVIAYGFAAAFFLGGRAVRWVLAGE